MPTTPRHGRKSGRCTRCVQSTAQAQILSRSPVAGTGLILRCDCQQCVTAAEAQHATQPTLFDMCRTLANPIETKSSALQRSTPLADTKCSLQVAVQETRQHPQHSRLRQRVTKYTAKGPAHNSRSVPGKKHCAARFGYRYVPSLVAASCQRVHE